MVNVVKPQVDCLTAEEFLDVLSPVGKHFKNEELDSPRLFRGQGQDWPLIPSLFRKNGKLKLLTPRNIEDYYQLRLAERDLLIRFFEIADKRGLVLPDDSQELRTHFEMLRSNDFSVGNNLEGWRVEYKGLSVIALAQHYGIPTRLLDWTLQPYIAAFFAGEDASNQIQELDKDSYLVVWSFYFPAFNRQTRFTGESYLIRGVTAPSATNVNLKAQQGVFTLVNSNNTNEINGSYLSLDEILKNYLAKYSNTGKLLAEFSLQKFTLPITEASNLLYLLAKMDITPSAVYPGYHSIVNDLRNQCMWENK